MFGSILPRMTSYSPHPTTARSELSEISGADMINLARMETTGLRRQSPAGKLPPANRDEPS
jgi:hypothetical protein